MVTFTKTRPLVNLQESDDARLQKVTVRWLSGREIWQQIMYFSDIWQIYYSGMVTFTTTRPLVSFQESDDARLQKRTVRWLSGREI